MTLDASASSQFVSGLLLAAARFERGVVVHHDGKPVPSQPHIAMTVEVLRDRGVLVDDSEPNTWRVQPGPVSAFDIEVEPDLSTAAPFLAAALVTRGRVHVPGWPDPTTQAGDGLRDILDAMGADVTLDRDGLTVVGTGADRGHRRRPARRRRADARWSRPLAALAQSPSWLRGVAHLRGHESDRLAALATEINGLGGAVTETDDGLRIRPAPLHGGRWATYHDHRMAMAGAVIGLAVPGRRRRGRRDHRQDAAATSPSGGRRCWPVREPPMSRRRSQRLRRVRRPGSPVAQGNPAADQGPAERTRTPSPGWWSASTAGATRCWPARAPTSAPCSR